MSGLAATEQGLFAMLTDEHIGIYLAHKGQPSWEAKMEEILTVKQYKVFMQILAQTNGATPQPINSFGANTLPNRSTAVSSSYAFNAEVKVPTEHAGRAIQLIRSRHSYVNVQLNDNEKCPILHLGANNSQNLTEVQRDLWKEMEKTFMQNAVIVILEHDEPEVLEMCSNWTEERRLEYQAAWMVTLAVSRESNSGSRILLIRGWNKTKCDNAKCKMLAMVGKCAPKRTTMPLNQSPADGPTPKPRNTVPLERQLHQMRLEDDDLDNYPDVMNILMLGESGVGKSTFINSFVNYLKFNNMQHAAEEGPVVLIRSMFNADGNSILCEPTIQSEQSTESAKYENLKPGESATQEPQSYIFGYPWKGKEKIIRIIDTPGVDDTRGMEACRENFNKILSFIADFDAIHAVCILLKPDKSKLTPAFHYSIKNLLQHLHKSASSNILFVFTHTQGTLARVGETPSTVRRVLQQINSESGIKVEMNKETMFCFDGESFRYLAQKTKGIRFEGREVQLFRESWDRSAKETLRLLERITTLRPHDVNSTLCLNNTRRVIQLLTKPLAEITSSIMKNEKHLSTKKTHIERMMSEGENLTGQLWVQKEVLSTATLEYPKTVCTSTECVEYGKVNGIHQTIYSRECHAHCYLKGVQEKTIENPILRHCWAMRKLDVCRICGHSWKEHMHVRYEIIKSLEQVQSRTVKSQLQDRSSQLAEGQQFLRVIEDRISALKKQKEQITCFCAGFSDFLKKNSIVVYNDGFKQYIQYQIKEERNKISLGLPDDQLRELERYAAEYDEQVKLIEETSKLNHQDLTIDDVNTNIQELMNLSDYGTFLQEVRRLEMLVAGTTTANLSQKIELRGWKKTIQANYN